MSRKDFHLLFFVLLFVSLAIAAAVAVEFKGERRSAEEPALTTESKVVLTRSPTELGLMPASANRILLPGGITVWEVDTATGVRCAVVDKGPAVALDCDFAPPQVPDAESTSLSFYDCVNKLPMSAPGDLIGNGIERCAGLRHD